MRKRLPDGASSADPKLMAKPIVVIAPCGPENTPRQPTAIPDIIFYSTTADPSNSKGSDVLVEARPTWTERPKYVELSALLSLTNDKGATVNSTPKSQLLSWNWSDERRGAAKPTGKPTTCIDLDIEECRGSRKAIENVKLRISSLFDCGHNCRSGQPKPHARPHRTGKSLVHPVCHTDDGRLGCSNKHERKAIAVKQATHDLPNQKNWWLASRCSPLRKPAPWERHPKELLLGVATQRSRPHRDIFTIKPRQNAQETEHTQVCPNSLSNSTSVVQKAALKALQVAVVEMFAQGKKLRPPKEKCILMSIVGDPPEYFVMHGEKEPGDITRIDAKKDLGIWLSPNLSFSLHLEKSAQKAFAVLRMSRRTFSRLTRTDFQILYGASVTPLLEYANPVVYSGRTNDVILIERVQRAATKMVAGLKSMVYETRLAVLDLFPLGYRRLRGDLILTYALFEQGLANGFFTVDPANTAGTW
ncbi:hypothetical protein CLF_102935 [Clonorchis sinensis]|uniref:Uncharacterized protein n=1 Tax=Clonorchis sinensis TaxID=79923 RepID=G7Y8T5_CLOSI|nr:hypothetical protein CLF_102935 [Clonorchis sinensis]